MVPRSRIPRSTSHFSYSCARSCAHVASERPLSHASPPRYPFTRAYIPVSEENTPPKKEHLVSISSANTNPGLESSYAVLVQGEGSQKRNVFSQTPVSVAIDPWGRLPLSLESGASRQRQSRKWGLLRVSTSCFARSPRRRVCDRS